MKYFILSLLFTCACSGGSMVTESYNEAGEKIVVVEAPKYELALVEIGKVCKEGGFTNVLRNASIQLSDGTRVTAKCGKEPIHKDIKASVLNWL